MSIHRTQSNIARKITSKSSAPDFFLGSRPILEDFFNTKPSWNKVWGRGRPNPTDILLKLLVKLWFGDSRKSFPKHLTKFPKSVQQKKTTKTCTRKSKHPYKNGSKFERLHSKPTAFSTVFCYRANNENINPLGPNVINLRGVFLYGVLISPIAQKEWAKQISHFLIYIFLEGAKTTTTSVLFSAVFHPCLASRTVRSRKSGVKAPKYAIKPLQTITSPEHRTARLGGVGTREAYARLKSCRIIMGHVISIIRKR